MKNANHRLTKAIPLCLAAIITLLVPGLIIAERWLAGELIDLAWHLKADPYGAYPVDGRADKALIRRGFITHGRDVYGGAYLDCYVLTEAGLTLLLQSSQEPA